MVRAEGIRVFLAAMFVSGELAGSGVLALPQAVGQSGEFLNLLSFFWREDFQKQQN